MSIRLIIQKSGRLSGPTSTLLKRCGYFLGDNPNRLKYKFDDLEVLLVRDDDIPRFVHHDVCDLGIVGLNQLKEYQLGLSLKANQVSDLEILTYLDFSYCRLSLAVPNSCDYDGLAWFNKKSVATSYPKCLEDFFKKNKIDANICQITGSVETAPFLGIADGICDLVATGSTLVRQNLKEVHKIFDSSAVVIARKSTDSNSSKKIDRINQLMQRIKGVSKAQSSKYVMMNAPINKVDEIVKLIPGLEKPSIMPLFSEYNSDVDHHDKTVAVHVVAKEEVFWSTIEKLKSLGASSILVVPIEKIID